MQHRGGGGGQGVGEMFGPLASVYVLVNVY